jgi:hypothetical protein
VFTKRQHASVGVFFHQTNKVSTLSFSNIFIVHWLVKIQTPTIQAVKAVTINLINVSSTDMFLLCEAGLLVGINIYILVLYNKYKRRVKNLEKSKVEYNSSTLFNNTSVGGWMLRLPIPIFSKFRDKEIQEIIRMHNRLTYVYYFLIAFAWWHFSVFVDPRSP